MLITETVNRVVDKELLVQTVQGELLTVTVDRDETLASFKKRLQNILTVSLEKSHLEFGSVKIPLGEASGSFDDNDDLRSPQLHASGRLRDFPNGAPVLLKHEDSNRHRRSLSSPNLSLSNDELSFLHSLRSADSVEDDEPDVLTSAASCSPTWAGSSLSLDPLGLQDPESPHSDTSNGGSSSGVRTPRRIPTEVRPSLKFVSTYGNAQKLGRMVREISSGFRSGVAPESLTDGLGGCYVFKNESGRKIAVVKPTDEEPLAPNNPKGFVGRALGEPGLKPTVRVGEAGLREAAAYLLDHGHFAKVPCTSLARMTHNAFNINASTNLSSDLLQNSKQAKHSAHTKLVSIQEFVEHQFDASDVGTAMFPVEAVHRIGILDIRLFNTDRHSGNILVCQKKEGSSASAMVAGGCGGHGASPPSVFTRPTVDLVPIDHGFCLPETLETVYFEWLHWPQASMPFSEEELAYIDKLDFRSDLAMLNRELPMLRVQSLRLLEVSTRLLKTCAAAGLNLAEIGSVMSKPLAGFDDEPSELERLCVFAKEEVVFSVSVNRRLSLGGSGSGTAEGGHDHASASEDTTDEDEDEESMFEMDDILSPAQLSSSGSSHSTPRSSARDRGQGPAGGSLRRINLRASEIAMAEEGGSGPSTPKSPSMNITRRHSSMAGSETSPWAGGFGGAPMTAISLHTHHHPGAGLMRGKPVHCDMPSSELKDLFSGMDQEMWHLFVRILFNEVDRALEEGLWRHQAPGENKKLQLGTSCPDF